MLKSFMSFSPELIASGIHFGAMLHVKMTLALIRFLDEDAS
jgi:hypothetical protein